MALQIEPQPALSEIFELLLSTAAHFEKSWVVPLPCRMCRTFIGLTNVFSSFGLKKKLILIDSEEYS